MRKSTCLCGIAFLLLFPLKANAQKSDVFLGYSSQLMEARPSGFAFMHGWEGSYTYNVSEYFGLTADLSGNYGSVVNSRMNFHSYLFGPQLHFDLPRHFAPLVQTLFGESRESYQGFVTKKFSFSLGGASTIGLPKLLRFGWSNGISLRETSLNLPPNRYSPPELFCVFEESHSHNRVTDVQNA